MIKEFYQKIVDKDKEIERLRKEKE